MSARHINNYNNKALVVGPIYNKLDKLKNALDLSKNYDLTIFNGNLCYPFDDLVEVQSRIDILDPFIKSNKVLYNLGNYDFKLINLLSEKQCTIKDWLIDKPNVIIIDFVNQSSIIITCGGVLPKNTKSDLNDNLETSFISNINNTPWHNFYGGGYGYIISNNPLTDKHPSFYNYSAQIGNVHSEFCQVYAQEIDQFGLKRTILL